MGVLGTCVVGTLLVLACELVGAGLTKGSGVGFLAEMGDVNRTKFGRSGEVGSREGDGAGTGAATCCGRTEGLAVTQPPRI